MRVRVGRLGTAYGPMERATGSRTNLSGVQQVIRLAETLDRPVRVAGAEIARDFVHVDDVAEAFYQLAVVPEARHVIYNVGAGRSDPLSVALDALADVAPGFRLGARGRRRPERRRAPRARPSAGGDGPRSPRGRHAMALGDRAGRGREGDVDVASRAPRLDPRRRVAFDARPAARARRGTHRYRTGTSSGARRSPGEAKMIRRTAIRSLAAAWLAACCLGLVAVAQAQDAPRTLTIGMKELPLNFDYGYDWSEAGVWVQSNIGDCLIWRDRTTAEYVPWLASDYTKIDDLVWRITIRPDIAFTNGEVVRRGGGQVLVRPHPRRRQDAAAPPVELHRPGRDRRSPDDRRDHGGARAGLRQQDGGDRLPGGAARLHGRGGSGGLRPGADRHGRLHLRRVGARRPRGARGEPELLPRRPGDRPAGVPRLPGRLDPHRRAADRSGRPHPLAATAGLGPHRGGRQRRRVVPEQLRHAPRAARRPVVDLPRVGRPDQGPARAPGDLVRHRPGADPRRHPGPWVPLADARDPADARRQRGPVRRERHLRSRAGARAAGGGRLRRRAGDRAVLDHVPACSAR